MAKQYHLVNRDGKALAEIILAKGVSHPEIGRALVASHPLQVVESDPKAEAEEERAAKKAAAEAKKAEEDARKRQGGGSQ